MTCLARGAKCGVRGASGSGGATGAGAARVSPRRRELRANAPSERPERWRKVRRREQAVHDALVGAGRVVGEKGVGLGGRGRQAGQIEINAAQQAGGIGLGRGRETFAAETREDEVVDGMAGGRGEFAGGGQRRARGFHVGPMLGVLGPDRALFDPAAQRGDLCRGQALALGRHHIVGVGGRDAGEQRAGVGLAGDERGFSRFAAPQRGAAGGEGKAALGFLRAVAIETAAREQGLDVAHKIDRHRRRRTGSIDGSREIRAEAEEAEGKVTECRAHEGNAQTLPEAARFGDTNSEGDRSGGRPSPGAARWSAVRRGSFRNLRACGRCCGRGRPHSARAAPGICRLPEKITTPSLRR